MDRSVLCLLIVVLLGLNFAVSDAKPGSCPDDLCVECSSDRDCWPNKRCCPTACTDKKTCCSPYGGQCPPVAAVKCLQPCICDSQCIDDLKCCSKDCIKQCVEPEGKPCHECVSDRNCPHGQRCCFDGCEKLCLNTGGGPCPPPRKWPCNDQCQNHDDCGRCERCERKGCWKRCVKPEKPPVKRPCDDCAWDCDCKRRGEKCCFDGCKWTCVQRKGACPPIPSNPSCDKCEGPSCCPNCHECRFNGCWMDCVKNENKVKPGVCPAPTQWCRACSSKLKTCYGRQKCCDDGCGFNRCVRPPKGDCRLAESPCCSDCDCKGSRKCCYDGCKHRCMKPKIISYVDHVGPGGSQ